MLFKVKESITAIVLQVVMKVSNRFEVSILCPNFDFSYFPFDNQNCTIALRGPNKRQNITLIENKVETKGGFEYVNLNLQYGIEPTEFDISAAIDPNAYVGVTLKFTRHLTPFSK